MDGYYVANILNAFIAVIPDMLTGVVFGVLLLIAALITRALVNRAWRRDPKQLTALQRSHDRERTMLLDGRLERINELKKENGFLQRQRDSALTEIERAIVAVVHAQSGLSRGQPFIEIETREKRA